MEFRAKYRPSKAIETHDEFIRALRNRGVSEKTIERISKK